MQIFKKSKFFKLKMADGRHIEYRFLAISRRLIGRSTRNSECRWRITCQYRSRDRNCNFPKFKMADGRHLENRFISIYQPWIIRFRSNLVHTDANFHSEHGNLTKNRNFSNSRWRTDAILKIVFWLYLGTIWADLCKFRKADEESHADIGHVTKTAIFANSRWRTAAILKIALSTYLSRQLSDFDQIW